MDIKWDWALFLGYEFPRRSFKPVLDEIDRVLAAHYGFTDEELDFISSTKLRTGIPSAGLRAGPSMKFRAGNYDINYRMGYGEIAIIEESRQEKRVN